MSTNKTVQLAINTIRTLAIDAIQKANSGHPGTVLDAAPMKVVTEHFGFTPEHVVAVAKEVLGRRR